MFMLISVFILRSLYFSLYLSTTIPLFYCDFSFVSRPTTFAASIYNLFEVETFIPITKTGKRKKREESYYQFTILAVSFVALRPLKLPFVQLSAFPDGFDFASFVDNKRSILYHGNLIHLRFCEARLPFAADDDELARVANKEAMCWCHGSRCLASQRRGFRSFFRLFLLSISSFLARKRLFRKLAVST